MVTPHPQCTPKYHGDDVDGILDYGQFGKCVYKNNLSWTDYLGCEDIIFFDCHAHNAELQKGFRFDDSIDENARGL